MLVSSACADLIRMIIAQPGLFAIPGSQDFKIVNPEISRISGLTVPFINLSTIQDFSLSYVAILTIIAKILLWR